MIDYREIAKSAPIFKGLSKKEKEFLLKDGKIHCLDKKEFLFRHGDPLLNFYIVCFGSIQIFRIDANGNEKTLHILSPQNIICGDKIFESFETHQFNAMAVKEAAVLEFSKIWLKENVKKYGNFALNLLAEISRESKLTELEAEHNTTMSVAQLISCFLQELCLVHGLDPHGFKLPYSKKLIASRLGIKLETLSRTLPKLKDCGINVEGSQVVIEDFDMMKETVCDHCSIEEDCPIHKNSAKKFGKF